MNVFMALWPRVLEANYFQASRWVKHCPERLCVFMTSGDLSVCRICGATSELVLLGFLMFVLREASDKLILSFHWTVSFCNLILQHARPGQDDMKFNFPELPRMAIGRTRGSPRPETTLETTRESSRRSSSLSFQGHSREASNKPENWIIDLIPSTSDAWLPVTHSHTEFCHFFSLLKD